MFVCWQVELFPEMIFSSFSPRHELKPWQAEWLWRWWGWCFMAFVSVSISMRRRSCFWPFVLCRCRFYRWSDPLQWSLFLLASSIFGAVTFLHIFDHLRCLRGQSTRRYGDVRTMHFSCFTVKLRQGTFVKGWVHRIFDESGHRSDEQRDANNLLWSGGCKFIRSDVNHRSKYSEITSWVALRLIVSTTTVSRNRVDAV